MKSELVKRPPAHRPSTSGEFLDDVVAGLSLPRKRLPCKYFYDARGSALFDRICELDEYYLTRAELAILDAHAGDMAARLGHGCLLIEYGSGSSLKTRPLLDHLVRPAGYAPVDVSSEHLLAASEAIAAAYPHVPVLPVCADFTAPFALPRALAEARRRVVYFPGSTIGNFAPRAAGELLRRIADLVGSSGGALIGFDLQKDPAILEAAYDDAQGVTAEFNMNLLARINRELGGTFALDRFAHRAHYDAIEGCIEMHLESLAEQQVTVGHRRFSFRAGETIHTECSYKHTLDGFAAIAAGAGLAVAEAWTGDQALFAVVYLTPWRGSPPKREPLLSS